MLQSFICRQRVANTFILALFKSGTDQCLRKSQLLFSSNIICNTNTSSIYLSSFDLSKKKKGSKKSKMTSSSGSSSPEILDLLPADVEEMADIANTQRKKKTVAENLRDNVRKWEATHSSEKRRQEKYRSISSSSPELVELSSADETDDSDDFEVIEVVSPPKPKPCHPLTYRDLYSEGCPLSERHWIDTPYTTTVRKSGGLPRSSFSFSVMSYNVLAQNLLEQHPDLYKHHQEAYLQWPVRHSGIMREIKHHFPDILCLQEVQATHAQQFFMQPLSNLGYEGIYKQRTGGKVDGCAILWQRGKFDLVEQTSLEFYQPGIDILNRDNIAVIVRLKVQSTDEEIVVATTHLLYNPKRADVRLAQIQLLLAELDRVSHEDLPIILTGDFNEQPHTGVYKLVARGQLNIEEVERADIIPSCLGITDCCRHAPILSYKQMTNYCPRDAELITTELSMLQLYHSERRSETSMHCSPTKHYKFGAKFINHALNLSSAHNHFLSTPREQEDATTYQDDWVTVDYIFFSEEQENTKLNRRRLKLLSRWSLPTVAECKVLGPIPNFDAPSDHLPIVACFVIN